MKAVIFLLMFLLLFSPLFGENILGEMAGVLYLESDQGTSPVEITLEDLAAVSFLYDNPFVQGVEFFFEIPQTTRNYSNSFALYLYRSVSPVPEPQLTSYRGSQFFMQIIPFSSDFSIKVPFDSSHNLKKDANSVVTTPVGKDDFPLLVTMLPIMKGLPSQAKTAAISMYARPLYQNYGGLKVIIEDRDDLMNRGTVLSINGKEVDWPKDYYSLDPGFHSVIISNEMSGSREFNIAVERGKITEVYHVLKASLPQLFIEPQEGITYFIDGLEISIEEKKNFIELEPGKHIITMKLNDSLILTKEYTFHAGENKTISLDAQILLENY